MKNLLVVFLGLLLSAPLQAATDAARLVTVKGSVWAEAPGKASRNLSEGDVVIAGETIHTGTRAAVKMKFRDGSRFELGSNAEFEIGEFRYQQGAQDNSFSSRIVKGAFRFFSGLIARDKPRSMSVGLSVATIGIRGTHVAGEVDPTSAKVVLMEPEVAHATSIEVYNDFGSVVVDEPGYGTEIPDEHSPPSPVRRMQLRTIDNIMRSLQSIQRMSAPRPTNIRPHMH